jgi:hypothetical protein
VQVRAAREHRQAEALLNWRGTLGVVRAPFYSGTMRAAPGSGAKILLFVIVQLGCGGTSGPALDTGAYDADRDAAPSDAPADQASGAADRGADGADAGGTPADAARDSAEPATAPSDAADTSVGLGDGASLEAGACAGETLSTAESAAYFPFTVGARWMFRGTGTSNGIPIGPRLSRREVTGTKTFGAATAAVVFGPEQDLNPMTLDDYLEVTAAGLVDHGSSAPPSIYERVGRYAAPFTAIPFPIQTCAPYQPISASVPMADVDGDGLPEMAVPRATTTLTFEDVTVPVGTFQRVLRVDSVESLAVIYSKGPLRLDYPGRHTVDWYASGVGPIKRQVEREGVKTTTELIAHSVGDARRGVVPVGWVARDVDEAGNNPYTPNRPAVGFDGTQFLVVVPTSKETGVVSSEGNLKAIIVDREGRPVSSSSLLDRGDQLHLVSLAWDGTRYLVVYHNASYGRIEMLTVSRNGQTINGPIVLEPVRGKPSVVATKDGFLVSYTKTTQELGTLKPLNNVWLATVDGQGHPTSRVQLYPALRQRDAVLAKDDAGGILALFTTPPATPSPTSPETADILAAARVTANGTAIDAAPFAVDAVPKVGHDDVQLIFDGTNFVAQWSQRVDSSNVHMHVARITPSGTLLGSATSGGIDVGGGSSPRLARFGAGSLIVWGAISGTRLTTDGRPLDLPGDSGLGRWFLADYGVGTGSSLSEILWAGDRALVVWANQASDKDLFDIGCALAYPW